MVWGEIDDGLCINIIDFLNWSSASSSPASAFLYLLYLINNDLILLSDLLVMYVNKIMSFNELYLWPLRMHDLGYHWVDSVSHLPRWSLSYHVHILSRIFCEFSFLKVCFGKANSLAMETTNNLKDIKDKDLVSLGGVIIKQGAEAVSISKESSLITLIAF